jgi:hypothetical protein
VPAGVPLLTSPGSPFFTFGARHAWDVPGALATSEAPSLPPVEAFFYQVVNMPTFTEMFCFCYFGNSLRIEKGRYLKYMAISWGVA